jgi:hypothetical protein
MEIKTNCRFSLVRFRADWRTNSGAGHGGSETETLKHVLAQRQQRTNSGRDAVRPASDGKSQIQKDMNDT